MRVLMVGVHKSTQGGMWTVAENYINNKAFAGKYNLKYIPSAVSGNPIKRIVFSVFGVLRVLLYALFHSFDLLHVHMSERMSVFRKGAVIKIAGIRKPKVIIHMHGAEFELWYKGLGAKKQAKVRRIINSADKIIILGEYWREFVSSLLEDKSKVEVVYNAVGCPDRSRYNPNARGLLFLGAIGKRKGVYDLLEAMKILKRDGVDTKLVLYGPDATDGIEALIEKYGLSDCAEYRGWLSKENKEAVFRETALNILPSYNEGLPMTILETMSFGIPNITTPVAAIPEVVSSRNGYLVSPGDYKAVAERVAEFLADGGLRKRLSESSYSTIKEGFSIEKHIEKITEIYSEVL